MASRRVSIQGTASGALNLVRRAVEESGLTVQDFEEIRGGFSCTTGAGITSWGSKIAVVVEEVQASATTVTISVLPRAQLIDWGRSAGELTSIINALNRLI
jgi:hypothetical protein